MGWSYEPRVSANGRYVVFTTVATNLTAIVDTNNASDVCVRDLQNLTTELASANFDGTASGKSPVQGNSLIVGSRAFGAISDDGSY